MALDPVCMMEITPDSAEAQLMYEGETIYFCCDECKRIFDLFLLRRMQANLRRRSRDVSRRDRAGRRARGPRLLERRAQSAVDPASARTCAMACVLLSPI